MITKNINKQPGSVVEVQVSMPWSDVEPKWNETLQRLSQDIELPGFRKGQAPLNMVEAQVGQKLADEVLKVIMPQALIDALQGTDIVPIDYPQYQVQSFSKGGDLVFTAKITERPRITVGDYKTIKVQKPQSKQVTEEEVNNIVDQLFLRWKSRNPQADQAPQQPAAGASGSMSFNNTAGSTAPQPQAETPNDEFAKAVGATDLNDLKSKIKQDLENESNYNSELDYEEEILQQVGKITQVDIPEVLIQDELNRMLVSLQRSVTERGLLLEEYLKGQNKTLDQIKAEWRPQAETNVKMELGLSEIARLENINISDDELQAEIDKIQDQRVKAQFGSEEPRMHLRHALRQTKTLNTLKSLVG